MRRPRGQQERQQQAQEPSSAPPRVLAHAQAAGFSLGEYALELEDILSHVVHASRRYRDDPEDYEAALGRARDLVRGWQETP